MDFEQKMPKTTPFGKSGTFGKSPVLTRTPTLAGSPKSKAEHMTRRKNQGGLTHREVGEDFNVSKSTSHRTVTKNLD